MVFFAALFILTVFIFGLFGVDVLVNAMWFNEGMIKTYKNATEALNRMKTTLQQMEVGVDEKS